MLLDMPYRIKMGCPDANALGCSVDVYTRDLVRRDHLNAKGRKRFRPVSSKAGCTMTYGAKKELAKSQMCGGDSRPRAGVCITGVEEILYYLGSQFLYFLKSLPLAERKWGRSSLI